MLGAKASWSREPAVSGLFEVLAGVNDNLSAEDAGVTPGMLLVLRQSTVKGGA